MDRENLFETFQNTVVSAIALHSFVLGYYGVAKHKAENTKYPSLRSVFFVLPIVYNYKAMETFKGSRQLYKVLQKESEIVLGLQNRAIKMTGKTFEALNLAFSKKILDINSNESLIELSPRFKTKKLPLPMGMNFSENRVKQISDCAFKLGGIFAKRSTNNIQFELNIKF